MTHKLSDKPSLVTVPYSQNVTKAGDLSSTKKDFTGVPITGGLQVRDGYALCNGSTYDELVFPQLHAALGSPVTKVVPNGPYRTKTIDVVFDSTPAGFSNIESKIFAYCDLEGEWRIRFRINGTATSSASFSFTLQGVVFDQTGVGSRPPQNYQAVSHRAGSGSLTQNGLAYLTNTILVNTDTPRTETIISGDVALESKPTWADANLESYPVIACYDNVASNAIGLPDATAESKGLTTLNQVAEAGRNYVINGGFDFWQRGTIFNLTGSSNYTSDRWIIWTANKTAGTVDVELSSDVPSNSSVKNSIKFINSSAVFSGTGSFGISQRIEAANFSNYAGQELIASFWIKSSVTGTISTNIRLSDNQNIAYPVTINQANTWEKKVIKITNTVYSNPKSTDLAAIKFTIGFYSGFSLANDGVWQVFAADVVASNSQSFNYENAIINITEVKLEEGAQATKFTRAGGTYAGELALCQRYLKALRHPDQFTGIAGAAVSNKLFRFHFDCTMRDQPSVEIFDNENTAAIVPTTTVKRLYNYAGSSVPSPTITSIEALGQSVGEGYYIGQIGIFFSGTPFTALNLYNLDLDDRVLFLDAEI